MRLLTVGAGCAAALLAAGAASAAVIYESRDEQQPDRLTDVEYAARTGMSVADVRSRYAATGELICPDSETFNRTSTVELVLRRDIVVVTGHAFFDPDTCLPTRPAGSCTVRFSTPDGEQEAEIGEVLGDGISDKCPDGAELTDHWLVGRLDRPIVGVTPYAVDLAGPAEISRDSDLVVVHGLGQLDFFARTADGRPMLGSGGDPVYLKSYALDCRWMRADPMARSGAHIWETTCDASFGASGGAMLDERPGASTPVLRAILMGTNETIGMFMGALGNNRSNSARYIEGAWASYFIPVDHELLDVLRGVAAGR